MILKKSRKLDKFLMTLPQDLLCIENDEINLIFNCGYIKIYKTMHIIFLKKEEPKYYKYTNIGENINAIQAHIKMCLNLDESRNK